LGAVQVVNPDDVGREVDEVLVAGGGDKGQKVAVDAAGIGGGKEPLEPGAFDEAAVGGEKEVFAEFGAGRDLVEVDAVAGVGERGDAR